jgi:hypothetical protein
VLGSVPGDERQTLMIVRVRDVQRQIATEWLALYRSQGCSQRRRRDCNALPLAGN